MKSNAARHSATFRSPRVRGVKGESARAIGTVCLAVVGLLQARVLQGATVTWDGGGDGVSWGDARNWTGDQTPSAADVAVIAGMDGTVNLASGDVTVLALRCERGFTISSGSLTITAGASEIGGTFRMEPGTWLRSDGATTSMKCVGPAVLESGSLHAKSGGVLSLEGGTNAKRSTPASAAWRVEGAGSRIVLAGVEQLTGHPNGDWWYLQAYDGGRLELPALTTLTDGWFSLYAQGAGAAVDCPLLATYQPSRADQYIQIEARTGGTVSVPALTRVLETQNSVQSGQVFTQPFVESRTRRMPTPTAGWPRPRTNSL